jgi:hypothetical protein
VTDESVLRDEIKRKLRKLKQFELKTRFGGEKPDGKTLVFDIFFDLRGNVGTAEYTLEALAAMSREAYREAISEYFARIYFELYRDKGFDASGNYDVDLLLKLGLRFDADEIVIKKRFRELAKQYHPDTGGDAEKFIALMEDYRKLTGK